MGFQAQTYCSAANVPTSEADLGSPISIPFGQYPVCTVNATYTAATVSTYFVIQTDMGDGQWIDAAWFSDGVTTTGAKNGVLSLAPTYFQAAYISRVAGTNPINSPDGTIGVSDQDFPGLLRFRIVAQAKVANTVTATIKYIFLPM